MDNADNDFKSTLFGQVAKAPAPGGFQPDPAAAEQIIKDGLAIAVFCSGCGYTQGLTKSGLDSLLTEAGLPLLTDPAEYRLECERCPICAETFAGMTLKKS